MFDTVLVLGAIIFFGLLTYALQVRNRKYKNYPTHCDVLYYPKIEKIKMIDPKKYRDKPYKFETRRNRETELMNKTFKKLIEIAINEGYSHKIGDIKKDNKRDIVNIILNMEMSNFKDEINKTPDNYPNDTILDHIY
jgi:2,3-bisphosphoglycerate-independent phosphoglycerate mutase